MQHQPERSCAAPNLVFEPGELPLLLRRCRPEELRVDPITCQAPVWNDQRIPDRD
jgi:hypothetical protein